MRYSVILPRAESRMRIPAELCSERPRRSARISIMNRTDRIYLVYLGDRRMKRVGHGGEVGEPLPKRFATLDEIGAACGVGDKGPHVRIERGPYGRQI